MPLDRLEKRILEDAWSRADAIEDEAKREAARILATARAQAREKGSASERSAKEEIRRIEAEQEEGMELQERGALLDARDKAMEVALARLRKLVVKRVKKEGYKRLVERAIGEASAIAPEEELTLVIGRNEARFAKGFGGRIKYGSVGNGVELRNQNGSVRITATIDGLFEENRQEIETMLLREAFPKRRRRAGGKRGR
ncbi:MAG: V-type ATP synthase subunit E [Candidatus Micrarchaeota archaeon]|nr:V-type ATP synthase subunit E [Candidatus Micrarchaeota archaeon]